MGLRFHKSLKIFSWLKLNFSKRGVSLSLGKPGATVNIAPDKVTTSVGVPGTGISYRTTKKID